MQIIEVKDNQSIQKFLDVAATIQGSSKNYIRPLDNEIEAVFDRNKNKHFQNGKATRWILLNDNGDCIGRIAAFVDAKYKNFGTDYPCGGVGYFECINDQNAANLLFDTAQNWLRAEQVIAMDGPINFGDRDKNWGLLVDGFDVAPYYGMSYNPPYYQALFENYGFQLYYNQYYFYMNIDDPIPAKFRERHQRIAKKADYQAKMLDVKQLEKFATDFATIYNAAWQQHQENKSLTKAEVVHLFSQMKPIIDPSLIWFAYYKEEPIAMWINIPDINQYFKHFNGKFGVWQKLQFLYYKLSGKCKRFTGLVFGVVPKYQLLGIDAFIIVEGADHIQKQRKYTDYEMGWTSEWNPKMLNMYTHLGSKKSRHMITYRYIFDNKFPVEEHPIMEYKR